MGARGALGRSSALSRRSACSSIRLSAASRLAAAPSGMPCCWPTPRQRRSARRWRLPHAGSPACDLGKFRASQQSFSFSPSDSRDPPRLPGPCDRRGFADERRRILRVLLGLAAAWAGAARLRGMAEVQGGAFGLSLLRHSVDAESFRVRFGRAPRRAQGALVARARRRANRHRPCLSARRLRASETGDTTIVAAWAVGALA
jgi:hypothetical protein